MGESPSTLTATGSAPLSRRHFGTVRRRSSDRWQALYHHDGRTHSAGVFVRKTDALACLAEIEVSLRRGIWTDPRAGRTSLRDYATSWLAHRANLAVRSREAYEYLFAKYIDPELGHHSLAALTPSMVRIWNAELAASLPSTGAKAYRLLSTMMKTAVMDGLFGSNPYRVVGASSEHAAERPIASLTDVHALAAAMPVRLRIVIALATWCELRRGEIFGLRRRDVDIEASLIHIEQSRTFLRDGSSLVKSPKTRAGRRVIAVPKSVTLELEQHLNDFVGDDPDSFLVTNTSGEPVTAMSLQRAWTRARVEVGRVDLHLHDLRHTGLTLAAASGATTAELMHRAGHASPEAALRYQHATRERDHLPAKSLESIISE
jgi:integrase